MGIVLAGTVGLILTASQSASAGHADTLAFNRALGVACTHCHVVGQWADPSVPVYAFAQRMIRMVDGLNGGLLKPVGGVTCWTCHRGRTVPARLPRESWQEIQAAHAADFTDRPERALAMSVYSASLGVDCAHCHTAGRWAENGPPAMAMVARMQALFDEMPRYFSDSPRKPLLQCYLCHQGAITPAR